ncbi:MAG TPA: tRNA (adenosine(37)-N6)-threonylcarbamoyltransferase complex dimerization subunit type 1 TsaB [Gemmataceae bacterium]|nr:tRNA (adenosine(37)-N6)-threonylcarbamoyltransferase complex dimerization subunit type 1 TsaB [Gemmataceae bacterium]
MLILETSGRMGRIAVAFGAQILAQRQLNESRRHARDLAPTVAELCRQCGWKVRELEAVLVSRGPGSYTGLRVGIMSAKALAYASGCVFLAIETFAAIARQAPVEAQQLDILADAQQQNLYVQRWGQVQGRWQHASPLTIRSATEWLAGLPAGVWVSGPGMRAVEAQLPASNRAVGEERREALPESLLAIGLERWQAGEADDFWTAEPLYLRPSNAERNWKKT